MRKKLLVPLPVIAIGSLKSLTPDQVNAIGALLAAQNPPPPVPAPASTDGPTLYNTLCAGCHGPLATSMKLRASATMIHGAINGNTGGMGSLSNLTSAQVAAIATALASQTPPRHRRHRCIPPTGEASMAITWIRTEQFPARVVTAPI